jgi:lipoprotein Spr
VEMQNQGHRQITMIEIPERFWDAVYNGAHFPGAPGASGLEGGANCQQFAYELLRQFGRAIPDFRSSELWADDAYTAVASDLRPLDLLLFNDKPDPFGAHVAVYLGGERAIHLCQAVGRPEVWTLEQFRAMPRYAVFIGAKHCA